MTRLVMRLTGVVLLGCIVVVLLTVALGAALPPEDEILLTAVLGENDLDIYRMALARHTIVLLTPGSSDEIQAAWSPDGQQIVFVSNRSGANSVYIMDGLGHSVRRLTTGVIGDYSPAWSWDGRWIVYAFDYFLDDFPTSRELMLYDMTDGSTRRLTNDENLDNNPSWSPDSTQIIYNAANKNAQFKLYYLKLQSGEITAIVTSADNAIYPIWSPDGHYIVFQNTGRDPGLYIWDTLQARSFRLTNLLDFIGTTVDWSSDSRYLIYANLITETSTGIFRMDVPVCIEQPTNCIPERIASIAGRYFNPRWRPHQP